MEGFGHGVVSGAHEAGEGWEGAAVQGDARRVVKPRQGAHLADESVRHERQRSRDLVGVRAGVRQDGQRIRGGRRGVADPNTGTMAAGLAHLSDAAGVAVMVPSMLSGHGAAGGGNRRSEGIHPGSLPDEGGRAGCFHGHRPHRKQPVSARTPIVLPSPAGTEPGRRDPCEPAASTTPLRTAGPTR